MKYASILVPTFLLVLLAAGATAQAAGSTSVNYDISARAEYSSCIVGFNIAALNAEINASSNLSTTLAPSIQALTSDNATLSGFTDSSDPASFSSFINGQLQVDLSAARQAYDSSLVQLPTGSLSGQISALAAQRDSCQLSNIEQIAQNRISAFNSSIAQYQSWVNQLSTNGDNFTGTTLNVTGMDAVVSNANLEVVVPLSQQVSAAGTNATLLRQALDQYCLFDGCTASGAFNYHLEAQFVLAYLTARGQQIAPLAASDNVSMTTFNTDLASASSLLATVGANAYQPGQSQQLFGSFAQAERDLSQVRQQISGYRHASELVDLKIQAYTNELNTVEQKIASLESSGNNYTNYSSVQAFLANANATIIVPLIAAQASGNLAALSAAAHQYCLTDGCDASGAVNFHLDAQLQFALLQARVQGFSQFDSNASADLTAYNTAVASVEQDFATIGNGEYQPGQQQQLTSDMQAANQALRQAMMQFMRQQNPNGMGANYTGNSTGNGRGMYRGRRRGLNGTINGTNGAQVTGGNPYLGMGAQVNSTI
jgi:hypothetical protein